MKNEEQVMCVPTSLVDKLLSKRTGFYAGSRAVRALSEFNRPKNQKFYPRSKVENDPRQQQIIPYIIVENTNGKILVMTRTPKQTETRLHNKLSLGIGGHINPKDNDSFGGSLIMAAAFRELREEIGFNSYSQQVFCFVGMLVQREDPVGKVHTGVVFHMVTTEETIGGKEKDSHLAHWMTHRYINHHKIYPRFEKWSLLLLNYIQK